MLIKRQAPAFALHHKTHAAIRRVRHARMMGMYNHSPRPTCLNDGNIQPLAPGRLIGGAWRCTYRMALHLPVNHMTELLRQWQP